MYVSSRDLKKGIIRLVPETPDDIYLLSLIIRPGDIIYAKTTRRIKRAAQDSVRPDEGRRETFTLGVKAENIELIGFSDGLRIHGIIIDGPEDKIDLYSHHTISVGLRDQITIKKEKWSKEDLEKIEEAVNSTKRAPLIIIGLDSDEATIALVSDYSTKYLSHFSPSITRKSSSIREHEDGMKEFWSLLTDYLVKLTKENNPDLIVIAGPGFWKDEFYDYAIKRAPELKKITIKTSASNGGKPGISEVLSRGLPAKIAEQRKASQEMELVGEVLKRLGKGENNITYGLKEVEKAAIYGAVDHLLVLDKLLVNPEEREKIEKIIKLVKSNGGRVTIMSSLHDSGKTVEGLSGIIALLRFPIN